MYRGNVALILALISFVVVVGCSCGDDDDDDKNDDDKNDDDVGDDEDSGDDDMASGEAWTDSSSGLTWEVEASEGDYLWSEATAHCAELTLDGGGWRTPTISELRTLVRGCPAIEADGGCGVHDDCNVWDCENDACTGCEFLGGPATGGAYWPEGMTGIVDNYWSSTQVTDGVQFVWIVDFEYGYVSSKYYGIDVSSSHGRVRCVKGSLI